MRLTASARLRWASPARRSRATISCASGLFLILAGCLERSAGGAPVLQKIDEIALAETDTSFVGEAYGFTVHSDGAFLVADRRNATIRVFSGSGDYMGSIGRRGRGPTEFQPYPIRVDEAAGSVLVVHTGSGIIKGLSYPDLQQLWEVKAPQWGFQVGARDSVAFVTHVDSGQRTSLVRLKPTGATEAGGPYYSLMGANQTLATIFSFAAVALLDGDSVAVAPMTSDSVFVGPFAGPYKAIYLPALARRGAKLPLLRAIQAQESPATLQAAAFHNSLPLAIARSSKGYLIYVVSDQTFIQDAMRAVGKLFVSVVNPETGMTCGEVNVPVPEDPHPQVHVRDDTLFVFSQVETPNLGMRSSVSRFLVVTDQCRLN